MTKATSFRWLMLVAVNAVLVGVLGFYSTSGAAPQSGQLPFANSVTQRDEMIQELREIKDLLKEQNALLRGGQLKTNVPGKP